MDGLFRAAKTGERMTLERAFENGQATPITADEQGNTLLHLAVESQKNELACIQLLLAHGCSATARNTKGASPLHYVALRKDNWAVVAQLLLDSGADVNQPMTSGHTPLHVACEKHKPEFVEWLLAHNANPNALDQQGNSPLHVCIATPGRDHVVKSIVQMLLDCHAQINAKNNEGNDALLLSAMKGYLKLGHFLIEKHAEIRTHNVQGNTVLHEAAKHGHAELMEILLTVPILNINATNIDEETPLHMATRYNHSDVALLLLRKKAATNVYNKDGQTAFDLVDVESRNIFDAKSPEFERIISIAKLQNKEMEEADAGCTLM